MTTTTTADQINALIAASTALKEYFEGHRDNLDADVASAQAAYAALATNLKGVIQSESYYVANVDPDGAYDPRSGGTFNTLRQAISSAPASSFVLVKLASGKTHEIDADIVTRNQKIYIQSSVLTPADVETRPVIAPRGCLRDGSNSFYQFTPSMTSDIHIMGCNIAFPGATDNAAPWNWKSTLVQYALGGAQRLGLDRCRVTGQSAAMGLLSCSGGSIADLVMFSTELVGPITAVLRANTGVARIASYSVTLSNGAVLTDQGTICTGNIVKN